LDILTEHGLAGIIGLLFNGLFAANYVIGSDGVNAGVVLGGWVDRRFKQLYVQIAYILAAAAWSFVISYILALAINYIPGLHLRASDEAELMGLDDDQLGEFAYDYVEVRRDYLAWTSPKDVSGENQEIPRHERHGINQHRDMLTAKPIVSDGSEHTGIGGDRHGVAAMEAEQEKHDG
jgi:ammonium transporter, Amt family